MIIQAAVPDTFFTEPPHFRWLIILYFFVGGISGGALALASLMRLFGRPKDRPFERLASYLSLAGAVISGILLILDLGVPARFWHMMIQDHTGLLMFKWWSPMSVGVWGLLVFGFFALLASLGALADEGRLRWQPLRALARPPVAVPGAVGGLLGGLFLAGYTGVLLDVGNRPIWADSSWLGVVFLLSALSTATAALLLAARWRRAEQASTTAWLLEFDRVALILELVAIIAFLVSLGGVVHALLNGWGILLVLGVIGVGILFPLGLGARASGHTVRATTMAAACVLLGGFLLRVVVLLSSEQIHVIGTQVLR